MPIGSGLHLRIYFCFCHSYSWSTDTKLWSNISCMVKNVLQFLSLSAHILILSNMGFQYSHHHFGFCGVCHLPVESDHSESKSDPTHETVTFFLYNSIKSATHSFGFSHISCTFEKNNVRSTLFNFLLVVFLVLVAVVTFGCWSQLATYVSADVTGISSYHLICLQVVNSRHKLLQIIFENQLTSSPHVSITLGQGCITMAGLQISNIFWHSVSFSRW